MAGSFKQDHLQPFKLILFPEFYNFSTLILERPTIITPRERKAENGKLEFSQLTSDLSPQMMTLDSDSLF